MWCVLVFKCCPGYAVYKDPPVYYNKDMVSIANCDAMQQHVKCEKLNVATGFYLNLKIPMALEASSWPTRYSVQSSTTS